MKLTVAKNVIFVKGYHRNLLIDLQNDCWYHIDFILENDDDINKLNTKVLNYMKDEGMIFEFPREHIEKLLPLKLEYDCPSTIENAIIDRNSLSNYSVLAAINFLNSLKVKHLQIRWFDDFKKEDLKDILDDCIESSIESIDIIAPYNLSHEIVTSYKKQYLKISRVIFHSFPENEHANNDDKEFIYTTEIISSSNNCGQISPYFFSKNQNHILKAINYNTCLYKKLSIDHLGNIKCPSLKLSFGNIQDINSVKTETFHTPYWDIKKDDVKICSDCEFRYVCQDCRAFLDDDNDIYSRPLKCGYNPYISKWKGDKDYLNFEDIGVAIKNHKLFIDHERIAKINKELWEE